MYAPTRPSLSPVSQHLFAWLVLRSSTRYDQHAVSVNETATGEEISCATLYVSNNRRGQPERKADFSKHTTTECAAKTEAVTRGWASHTTGSSCLTIRLRTLSRGPYCSTYVAPQLRSIISYNCKAHKHSVRLHKAS